MPTPTPTESQVEQVREIALLYSYAQTATLVNLLNDAQWTATINDFAAWEQVKNKHTQIKGDGVDINKDRNRLDITIRVRRRLGELPADPTNVSESGSYSSYRAVRDDENCRLFE